jgi:hypothetical protein
MGASPTFLEGVRATSFGGGEGNIGIYKFYNSSLLLFSKNEHVAL